MPELSMGLMQTVFLLHVLGQHSEKTKIISLEPDYENADDIQ